jgi:hypothetical protein
MPITPTVLTIGGTAQTVPRGIFLRRVVTHVHRGIPSCTFSVTGKPLPGLPDPFTGKVCTVDVNGTRRFTGDVTSCVPDWDDHYGLIRTYNALGLRNRGDWFRHTDSNTGLDTSVYNATQDNQASDYLYNRAGRTVGQILTDVLTMAANAANLAANGLGALTFPSGVPTLPAATVSDLALLTLICPAPVYFGGEKFMGAVESFLATWAPNHCVYLDPATGAVRVIDMRTYTPATLTMGSDPVHPARLSRDVGDCFQRAEGVGQPVAEMFAFSLSSGILTETPFIHDGLTIAQSKAAFDPNDYSQPGQAAGQATAAAAISAGAVTTISPVAVGYGYGSAPPVVFSGGGGSGAAATAVLGTGANAGKVVSYTRTAAGSGYASAPLATVGSPAGSNSDTGTLTCTSTTTVTLTSARGTTQFPANFWDYSSTGRHGTLFLSYAAGTSITTFATRATLANAAMTPGGTALFTLDRPLPHLLYTGYRLTGNTQGASDVYRRYGLPAWAAPAIAQQTTYPFALHLASNTAETLTSNPMGLVFWGPGGLTEAAAGVSVDVATGTVLFAYPTALLAGGDPVDVVALVPINTGLNLAVVPADTAGPTKHYTGTSNAREGLTKTLQITLPAWRDPANLAAVTAFLTDTLDSVSDAVIEGQVEYLGLYEPGLTPGLALNIAGTAGPTGWESGTVPALPVVEGELTWSGRGGSLVKTTMRCSNRRARFGADAFMHPDRTGVTFDWGDASINYSGPKGDG